MEALGQQFARHRLHVFGCGVGVLSRHGPDDGRSETEARLGDVRTHDGLGLARDDAHAARVDSAPRSGHLCSREARKPRFKSA